MNEDENNENDIALQALPTDAIYNRRLGGGIDVLMGWLRPVTQ
jgi:hypothetical protein